MLRTPRRRLLAAVLAAAVVLGPALPVLAAPDGWSAATIVDWLTSWLFEPDAGRTQAGSETVPDWDPDGLTEQPQPSPAGSETSTTDDDGEAFPDWDPNG